MNLNDVIAAAIRDAYPTGIAFLGTTTEGVYIDWVDDSSTYIQVSEVRATTGA